MRPGRAAYRNRSGGHSGRPIDHLVGNVADACQDLLVKVPLTPVRAGAALFSRAVIVLAAATAVFLLVNYIQGEGICNPERTAANAIVMAATVAFLGLAAVPFAVLGKRYRGVRAAALLGWTASLLPALLLLLIAARYIASVIPGCPM